MFYEYFAKSPLLALPLVSLLIFLGTFVVAVAFVVRRGRALEAHASLALESEVGHE